jgi:hypothetical protein
MGAGASTDPSLMSQMWSQGIGMGGPGGYISTDFANQGIIYEFDMKGNNQHSLDGMGFGNVHPGWNNNGQ